MTAHMAGKGNPEPVPRGDIKGWTAATARRQRDWLGTVDAEALSGFGYAVTLTMRETPASAEEFHRLRRMWLKRVERMGATRVHWVVEWQARGTPHLHCAVYFTDAQPHEGALVAVEWLLVSQAFGVSLRSQDVKPIAGALGWLKYLAKHASRGAMHYQRRGHPEGWDKSGRMWGHTGVWPVVEPVEYAIANSQFYRVRRIARSWAIAEARKAGDWRRVKYLRRRGPASEYQSRYRGVSEWIPEPEMLRLIDYLDRELPTA
jgi:hypothetical protein